MDYKKIESFLNKRGINSNQLITIESDGPTGTAIEVGQLLSVFLLESQPPSSNASCTCVKNGINVFCDNSCKPSSKDVKTAEDIYHERIHEVDTPDGLIISGRHEISLQEEIIEAMKEYASQFNPPSGGGSKEDAEFLRGIADRKEKHYNELANKANSENPEKVTMFHDPEIYTLRRIASNIEQGK